MTAFTTTEPSPVTEPTKPFGLNRAERRRKQKMFQRKPKRGSTKSTKSKK